MLNSCVRDFDECYCDCHNNKNIKHIVACCTKCNICYSRIKSFSNFDKHYEKCSKDFDKQMETMMGRPLTEEERKIILLMKNLPKIDFE